MTRRKSHRTILLTVAFAFALAAAPNGSAGLPAPSDDAEGLDALAGMLNTHAAVGVAVSSDSCEGGEGCGYCKAEVECSGNATATCTCADTGKTCWSWFHKKAVYACDCTCVSPPAPPPDPPRGVCVYLQGDEIACVSTEDPSVVCGRHDVAIDEEFALRPPELPCDPTGAASGDVGVKPSADSPGS